MDVHDFIHKWKRSTLKESAGSHEHFIDLCRVLNQPTPAESDSKGAWYTFEKGANKLNGRKGFADVWKRGCFAWEYKGKHKDLKGAYTQLLQYRSNLENPPLLIVSDMKTIEIHTNWTGTVEKVITFELDDLADGNKLRDLGCIFTPEDVDRFKPDVTTEEVTEQVAQSLGDLAQTLRDRGHDPQQVAHFLSKVIFCMFAQNVNLLPDKLIKKMIDKANGKPNEFCDMLRDLFLKMNEGGRFGMDKIEFFNGGLFDDDLVIPLERDDLDILKEASGLDWGKVEPSIFGTLFERGFDPAKRAQLGKHYTHRIDIEKIIIPVIYEPLMRRWRAIESMVDSHLDKLSSMQRPRHLMLPKEKEQETKTRNAASRLIKRFLDAEVRSLRILDPACGSGNFLYVALEKLHEVERVCLAKLREVNFGQLSWDLRVSPHQVYGIEINQYAYELAQVTVWIGHLQWMHKNGFGLDKNPVLKKLDNFQHRNAILKFEQNAGKGSAVSIPVWPTVDVIVGNPPFLGHHKMRKELGPEAQIMFDTYKGVVAGKANLVCYWFELARQALLDGRTKRVGLVSTRSITSGPSNDVLQKIARDAEIYDAWPNELWIVEGADLRTSLVCFAEKGAEPVKRINGEAVPDILSDLNVPGGTGKDVDHTKARQLAENSGIAHTGTQRTGPFDIPLSLAKQWMSGPRNINKRPNSDVLFPFANTRDIAQRTRNQYIIDFGQMDKKTAAQYEKPFEYVKKKVLAKRTADAEKHKSEAREEKLLTHFWQFQRSGEHYRKATKDLSRFILTTRHSEYRLFVWAHKLLVPDNALYVLARDDDTFFGIIHSRFQEMWAVLNTPHIGKGGQGRYSTARCFLNFPFPQGLTPNIRAKDYSNDRRAIRIANAARKLDEMRNEWLYPDDLVRRCELPVPGYPAYYEPIDDADAAVWKKRTLTNLYNERPQWLLDIHADLDEAVAAAYGWPANITNEEALAAIVALNLQRKPLSKPTEEADDVGEENE